MRNPKVYGKFVSIVYVWLCINTGFVLVVLYALYANLVKLTFVEVHDKKGNQIIFISVLMN
jgi:hypothetical protein